MHWAALSALCGAVTDGPRPSPLCSPGRRHCAGPRAHSQAAGSATLCFRGKSNSPSIVRPHNVFYAKLRDGFLQLNFRTDLFSGMKTSFCLGFSAFLNSQEETETDCPLSPKKKGFGCKGSGRSAGLNYS